MFINRSIILLAIVFACFAAACSGSSVSSPTGTDGDLDADSVEASDSDTSSESCTLDDLRCTPTGEVEICGARGWTFYRACPEGWVCETGLCVSHADGDTNEHDTDADAEQPGTLGGECIDGTCLTGLVCISNQCLCDGNCPDGDTDAETEPPVDGDTEAETPDADSEQPGTLGGACIGGVCLTGLECADDVCVMIDGDVDTTDADTVDPDLDTDTELGLYGVVWVSIPAGSYLMGAPEADADGLTEVLPQHFVTVRAFQMMSLPASRTQVLTALGSDTDIGTDTCSSCDPSTRPAKLTYAQAQMFCYKVGGRLPSEAEYEYAARAGTTAKFYCSNTDSSCLTSYEWLKVDGVHVVGQKLPNAWGLYDMIGNWPVWTADCWHSNYVGAPTDGSPWTTNCATAAGNPIYQVTRAFGMLDTSDKYRAVWARRFGTITSEYEHYTVRCVK